VIENNYKKSFIKICEIMQKGGTIHANKMSRNFRLCKKEFESKNIKLIKKYLIDSYLRLNTLIKNTLTKEEIDTIIKLSNLLCKKKCLLNDDCIINDGYIQKTKKEISDAFSKKFYHNCEKRYEQIDKIIDKQFTRKKRKANK